MTPQLNQTTNVLEKQWDEIWSPFVAMYFERGMGFRRNAGWVKRRSSRCDSLEEHVQDVAEKVLSLRADLKEDSAAPAPSLYKHSVWLCLVCVYGCLYVIFGVFTTIGGPQ